jgi:outer membrane protein OmpA-like peptidoglycan-associated protein
MKTNLLTGMGLAMALSACVSSPQPNAALESARTTVHAAEADPNVPKYAALDLETAKKYLATAEDAALHHHDADVDQPAYLAAQNARLAEARATAKADDARVAAGQTERDQITLAARTREVQNARTAANAAKMATNEALNERDQATQEAALANQQTALSNQQAAQSAQEAALSNQQAAQSAQNAALSNQQAAQSAQEAARLQAEVDALKAKPTPRGLVITLGNVLFNTGKASLNPGAGRRLDQLAQFLNEHPDRRVQIDGFTDSVGTDSYNDDLSSRRADAVKSALISRGIDSSRIGTQGYGKAYPVADNNDSGGRQLNRRVEVVIGNDNGSPIAPRSGV